MSTENHIIAKIIADAEAMSLAIDGKAEELKAWFMQTWGGINQHAHDWFHIADVAANSWASSLGTAENLSSQKAEPQLGTEQPPDDEAHASPSQD